MVATPERLDRGRLSLIACTSGRTFAEKVEHHLLERTRTVEEDGPEIPGPILRKSEEIVFANGELKTTIGENVRGDDLYVIQCMDDPVRRFHPDPSERRTINDNLMGLLTAVNAAYQSDADSITAVIPQFCYSRQERKKTRECITARLVAAMIEDAGADRVLTLDIHAEAIQGFFQRAILEDLHASNTILEWFKGQMPTEDLVVVAPDTGSAERARHFAQKLGCAFAVVDKARDYSKPSKIDSMRLVGDVSGRRVIMPDDIVATGGTLINACRLLRSKGAREIHLSCSLPFFNKNAAELLDDAHSEGLFQSMIGTDAVTHPRKFQEEHPWYKEVSVAPLFARVILNINRKRSVSELLR